MIACCYLTNILIDPTKFFFDAGPADTYSNSTSATSLSQCITCHTERTTGDKNASMTSDSCICRRSLYYQQHTPDPQCVNCPVGANCNANDGLTLSQVIPKPGYYLSTLKDDATTTTLDIDTLPHHFLDCKIGYKTDKLAKEICIGGERNLSKMCKEGYAGPLCVSN